MHSYYVYTAICYSSCGTNEECSLPDTCTCVEGWNGTDCLTGQYRIID